MKFSILENTSPTKFSYADLQEGTIATLTETVTEISLQRFIETSGDMAANHVNAAHAKSLGFRDRIVHGFYTALPFSRLLGMYLPGPRSIIQTVNFKFLREVYVGDTLTYEVSIERLIPAVQTVKLALSVNRNDEEIVCSGVAQCVFK